MIVRGGCGTGTVTVASGVPSVFTGTVGVVCASVVDGVDSVVAGGLSSVVAGSVVVASVSVGAVSVRAGTVGVVLVASVPIAWPEPPPHAARSADSVNAAAPASAFQISGRVLLRREPKPSRTRAASSRRDEAASRPRRSRAARARSEQPERSGDVGEDVAPGQRVPSLEVDAAVHLDHDVAAVVREQVDPDEVSRRRLAAAASAVRARARRNDRRARGAAEAEVRAPFVRRGDAGLRADDTIPGDEHAEVVADGERTSDCTSAPWRRNQGRPAIPLDREPKRPA